MDQLLNGRDAALTSSPGPADHAVTDPQVAIQRVQRRRAAASCQVGERAMSDRAASMHRRASMLSDERAVALPLTEVVIPQAMTGLIKDRTNPSIRRTDG
jgi:hypothetical protein